MAQVVTPPPTMTDPTQRRFRGSAKIDEYEVMKEKLGEGTFGYALWRSLRPLVGISAKGLALVSCRKRIQSAQERS